MYGSPRLSTSVEWTLGKRDQSNDQNVLFVWESGWILKWKRSCPLLQQIHEFESYSICIEIQRKRGWVWIHSALSPTQSRGRTEQVWKKMEGRKGLEKGKSLVSNVHWLANAKRNEKKPKSVHRLMSRVVGKERDIYEGFFWNICSSCLGDISNVPISIWTYLCSQASIFCRKLDP